MAWSREINAEHFVGVSAGSQIGARGAGDYGRGGDRRFHTTSAYHCVRARGAGAPEGELSLDDCNDRVVRCSTSAVDAVDGSSTRHVSAMDMGPTASWIASPTKTRPKTLPSRGG